MYLQVRAQFKLEIGTHVFTAFLAEILTQFKFTKTSTSHLEAPLSIYKLLMKGKSNFYLL